VNASNDAAWTASQSTMIECEYCGRRFTDANRLAVHHKSCTQERPAKRVGAHK
jgi:hypothetical protein